MEILLLDGTVWASDETHDGEDGLVRGIVMETHGYPRDWTRYRRKAIPATCGLHRGPIGFANLMVNERDGTIVFDPRVTGECLISLDEQGTRRLRGTLTEWLG